MTFNSEFMKKAVSRIDELQNDMIQKSNSIPGANEYIQKKMELFNEDQALREKIKLINNQEKLLTDSFINPAK